MTQLNQIWNVIKKFPTDLAPNCDSFGYQTNRESVPTIQKCCLIERGPEIEFLRFRLVCFVRNLSLAWEIYSDKACSFPGEWRVEASWGPN